MYYRDEDPARTSSPDECFNSFMSDLTGRSADDIDFYEKRPIDPEPSQYEKEQEALRKAEHDKQVNYFMKAQIDRYARSSEQRDMMYKQHGINGE
jgi:hypothetical protein